MGTRERLYLYDENDNELLWIDVNGDHSIELSKNKESYYLINEYYTEIKDFLKNI